MFWQLNLTFRTSSRCNFYNYDNDDEETKLLVAFEWLGSSHGLVCFAVGFKEASLSSDENEESRNERLSFPVISKFKYPMCSHNQS